MTLGTAGVAGNSPYTFNRPTDVAVAPSGEIYVTDGHGPNNRVVKFSRSGQFLTTWGHPGSGPGEFNQPHTLTLDSRGRVFVGDRSNSRIQIFEADGTFVAAWTQFGRPSGMFIDHNDMLYVADYEKLHGVTYGNAEDGTVLGFIEGSEPEGVVVDLDGNVYTGEVTGGESGEGSIMRKFIKQ